MNPLRAFALTLVVPFAALACQEKPADPAAATPTPIATTPPPPAATPAPTPAPAPAPAPIDPVADLPTPEEFEQQALDEINPQNLELELDKLEKEIGQ